MLQHLFARHLSSNKFDVLDLASDVVLFEESDDSHSSEDSDDDFILNLKTPDIWISVWFR